ncbi:heme-binding protein [Pseudomonas sp. 2FG]|uniref:heme-binding protein n=1 Tax=Pseudomonas sp. 2FG TaxID=2502191 RepID=UPI0010F892B7|nr:heme-binding protein [Pseudomonas sp. 2FG]
MTKLLRQQNSLSLDLAMPVLQAALDQAAELNVRVSIAIVDAAGHLIHMAHIDNAPLQLRDRGRPSSAGKPLPQRQAAPYPPI